MTKNPWENFVLSINFTTPAASIWNIIRRLKGIPNPKGIDGLVEERKLVTSLQEIANCLARSFAKFPAIKLWMKNSEDIGKLSVVRTALQTT